MSRHRVNGSGLKLKLAAAAAILSLGAAGVAAPAALALNPQPLPPIVERGYVTVAPPGLIGGLTCHEYGCL